MNFNTVRSSVILILTLLSLGTALNAQILEDQDTFGKIKKGVDHIYNLEFDEAQSIYRYIKSKYPNHSVPYLFQGMILYWQNYPLVPGTESSRLFVENLEKCYDLADKSLKENKYDAENLLAGLGALGMLLLYYADNGLTRNVLSLAPETYHFVMKSFDYTNSYSDFYFITGLYNYYREAYPEVHPAYKPITFFFPRGDKKLGLKQLKIASDSSIFLKAEANTYLSGIYQSFERNPKKALIYSSKLVEMYSNNVQFLTSYVKDLLLAKKYSEAEEVLDHLPFPSDNNYFQAQVYILRGIIYEKKYKQYSKAEKYYRAGIRKASLYKDFGNDYQAYGYFGLSRVYTGEDEKKIRKQYRRQARDLADYEYINFDD